MNMMHQVIDKRKHNVSRLFSETRERKTQREKAVNRQKSYSIITSFAETPASAQKTDTEVEVTVVENNCRLVLLRTGKPFEDTSELLCRHFFKAIL